MINTSVLILLILSPSHSFLFNFPDITLIKLQKLLKFHDAAFSSGKLLLDWIKIKFHFHEIE